MVSGTPLRAGRAPLRAVRIGVEEGIAGGHGLPACLQVLGYDAGTEVHRAVEADACTGQRLTLGDRPGGTAALTTACRQGEDGRGEKDGME